MATDIRSEWARDALALEKDFNDSDGTVFDDRDAAIDGYVRMCRDKNNYRIGKYVSVMPDYYPLADDTGRFVIGFTLFVGKAEMGKVRSVYTDDISVTVELEDLTLTCRNAKMKTSRR